MRTVRTPAEKDFRRRCAAVWWQMRRMKRQLDALRDTVAALVEQEAEREAEVVHR